MSKLDHGFQIIEIDEHHVKATAFNMLFMLWCKETQRDAFKRGRDALVKLALDHREGVGVFNMLEQGAVAPSSEARDEITMMLKEGGNGNLKHYSVLYEGTGFKAASIRAVVSTSHMIARVKTNLAVFATLSEAVAWQAEQQRLIGRRESGRDISVVVRRLRETYAARLPEFVARGTLGR